MVTLKDWFQEKDYGIGLAILGKYCKNRFLVQHLGRRKKPKKLEYELRKIANRHQLIASAKQQVPAEEQAEVKVTQAKKQVKAESHSDHVISQMNAEPGPQRLRIIRNENEVKYDDLPKVIQALWDTNRDAYKEIRSLHEKLKLMEKATPEDRQPLTERISALDDSIRANWKEIDAWDPNTHAAKQEAATINHKRINSNRKYISTNLKKLPETTNAVKKARIVAELQLRYNELKAASLSMSDVITQELVKVGVEV